MQTIRNKRIFTLAGIIGIILFFGLLYKLYIPHITAFGCFDDCFNFMGGYFLLQGKHLYTQIFFNHAPLMAYLSALVQMGSHPINIYDIVLRHRQFLFGFALVANIFLFLRFGKIALLFTLLYELTKFYVFGDRFLGEAFVVYPLVYMGGALWERMTTQKRNFYDDIAGAMATWFVIFMREPYALVAVVLFVGILWSSPRRNKVYAFALLLLISTITIFFHNAKDFYFNVVTVNQQTILSQEGASNHIIGSGLLQIFFYPFFVLIGGKDSFLRTLLIGLSSLFIVESIVLLVRKEWKPVMVVWVILGLANLRFTPVGQEYYEAFHMIVWYGLLVAFSALLLRHLFLLGSKWRYICLILYIVVLGYSILPPKPFFYAKTVEHDEFITNYGYDLQLGNVVGDLSSPKDTLFLDGTEDMIYWISKRDSSYAYSWYTSVMPGFSVYTHARQKMLATNPPDFYYGTCKQWPNKDPQTLRLLQKEYQVLYTNNKPSCLWIKKTKFPNITQEEWSKANAAFYYIPSQ